MLTDAQQRALLTVARDAMARHLLGHPPVEYGDDAPSGTGVFVTIKRSGELRGCLGVLELRGTLVEEVARCARESATEDPRFPPMTPAELASVSVEISVLGPLEEVDPLDEASIVIGAHGVVIEHGHCRGLLLPQVAVEWGWNREQLLRQTCRKARLPEDAWSSGARVFRFDAQVFGDGD